MRMPSIGRLIYGGFLLMVVIITAASLLSVGSLYRISGTFADLQRLQQAGDLADEIERRTFAMRLAARDAVNADPAPVRAVVAGLSQLLRDARPALPLSQQDMIDGMAERLARYQAGLEALALSGQKVPAVDWAALDEEARLISRVAELLRRVAARSGQDTFEHLAATLVTATQRSLLVGLVCVVIGVLGALLVVRQTVRPLRAIVQAMRRVTEGGRDTPIPYTENRHEIGDMARATEALRDALTDVDSARQAAQLALTERRNAEAEYAKLFEQSVDGVYKSTPGGTLLRTNPAMAAMLGYADPDQLVAELGAAVSGLYLDQADCDRFQYAMQQDGFVRAFEYQAKRRDGTTIWVSDSATVARNQTGQAEYYEGILRDITSQKQIAVALAESQRRLREVIDTIPACVNVKDRALRYVVMNRYMAGIFGIDPQDAMGFTTGELMARYNQSKSDQFDNTVLQSGAELGFYEDQYFDASGTMRYFLCKKVPLLDANGHVDSILAVALDIGDRKKAEADLQAAKEAAEAATLTKSAFLAAMSHEIRTPMNGMLGMMEVLEHSRLDATQRKQVQIIRESAGALLRILNDILDLSKLEAEKLELEMVPFALNPLLEGVSQTFAANARQKGVSLTVDADPDLPRVLVGDPDRLRQVLLNLVGNAVKFTMHGCINLSAERVPMPASNQPGDPEKTMVRIAVRDTGIGMDAQTITQLFQPFAQADSSTARRFGGTGLGLSISGRIVALMNGTVHVDSVPSEGSTFTVVIPLQTASSEAVPEPHETEGAFTSATISPNQQSQSAEWPSRHAVIPDHETARHQERLILVVDDHPTNREVILRQLAILGYAADAVDNGRQALEALLDPSGRPRYALLLTDCHMPVMDGFELTAHLRAAARPGTPRLPIVAITANAMAGEAERCLAAGMDSYLSKPIGLAALRVEVARWLPTAPTIHSTGTRPAGQQASEPPPVLDTTTLSVLLGGDRAGVHRLLGKYVKSTQRAAGELHSAALRGSAESAQKAGQRLASAASTVGSPVLAGLGREFEQAAAAGNWNGFLLLQRRLDAEIGRLELAIDTFMDS